MKLKYQDILEKAEKHADNLNDCWTNDFHSYLRGFLDSVKLLNIEMDYFAGKYECLNNEYEDFGINKGDVCEVHCNKSAISFYNVKCGYKEAFVYKDQLKENFKKIEQ